MSHTSGHAHGHRHDTLHSSDARLIWAIAVNMLLTVAQIVGGLLAGSLSLIADALHNLNDAASLGLALVARRIARKPADPQRTFGYRRAEVIGALINLTALIIVGLYLIYEAAIRFVDPQPIGGWIVVGVAGVALLVDIITAMLTWSLAKGSINIRAAFIHNVSDALASVAVIVAGTLILLYEFYIADLIATLLIAAYILYQGFAMMTQAIYILMESTPAGIDLDELVSRMEAVPRVRNVHHVHAWQIDEHHKALEAHIVIAEPDIQQMEEIKSAIKTMLARDYDITHSTLEIEFPTATNHDTARYANH